jgi:GNAT superfamily N-acetyltransferase
VPPVEQRIERSRRWAGPIGAPHPRHGLLVAERSQRLIGFAAVGPARDADEDSETTGELRVIIIEASERGTGVGAALLLAAEHAMRQAGLSVARLWVVPNNTQAVRCYERCGWHADGAEKLIEIGGRLIAAIRYSKQLTT